MCHCWKQPKNAKRDQRTEERRQDTGKYEGSYAFHDAPLSFTDAQADRTKRDDKS